MKTIILAVLSYAVLLEAYPSEVFDIVGKGVGSGLGLGVGVGTGIGIKGVEAVAVGPISAAELGSHTLEEVIDGYATGLETGLALAGISEEEQESGGYQQQRQPGQQQQRQPWQQQQRQTWQQQQRQPWQQQQRQPWQQQQRHDNQGYKNQGQRLYGGPYSQNNRV